MRNMFTEWSSDIKKYCQENNLDFSKAERAVKCWDKNNKTLYLQYVDWENANDHALMDSVPAPIILKMQMTDSGLEFTQTENTRKYLA